jgi:cytosine/adenosine deaminase-related metal-dependent hydrolase
MAGTDTAAGVHIFPGFSLHQELALFVKAGLTPLEALQTATLNPAKFLNRQADLGTVERGKLADLVLLDADPLQNIDNANKIRAVVLAGRYLDRAALDGLLKGAAQAAKTEVAPAKATSAAAASAAGANPAAANPSADGTAATAMTMTRSGQ